MRPGAGDRGRRRVQHRLAATDSKLISKRRCSHDSQPGTVRMNTDAPDLANGGCSSHLQTGPVLEFVTRRTVRYTRGLWLMPAAY